MNTGRSKAYVSSRRYGTPQDNLTMDAIDAERAGMTYGKYKAQHPNTKDANEARLAENRKQPRQSRKVYENTCLFCGEQFTTMDARQRYCGDVCKKRKNNAKYWAKKAQQAKEEEKKSD